jgi:hypothetical protein
VKPETSTGRRERNGILLGNGMVTPVRHIEVTYEGRREILLPRRHRLAPRHEIVQRHPELFMPADRSDKRTAQVLRGLVKRSGGRAAGGLDRRPRRADRVAPDSSYGLAPAKPSRRPSWRL